MINCRLVKPKTNERRIEMWKRGKYAFFAISVIALVVSAVMLSCAEAASTPAGEPIKIGLVLATTGPLSVGANGAIVGSRMAEFDINRKGGVLGRPIQLILRDDAGNPELATRYSRELILKDGVVAIHGGFSSALALASAPVARELKTPIFIWGKSEKVLIDEWSPYIFRYQCSSNAEARACARITAGEVLKNIKNPKVYWISWDYEYGHSLYKPFMEKIMELRPDVKLIGEAWPRTGEVDYSPFIVQMLAKKPDVVVNAIWGGGILSFMKQGAEYGLWKQSTFVSMAEVFGVEYRKAFGFDIPLEAWGNTHDDPGVPNNDKQREFYKIYYDFRGTPEPETGYTPMGYYMIQVLARAIEKAGSLDKDAIAKAMKGMTINTYWGDQKIRDFDHQVTSGQVWGPVIKKEGLKYLVMDPTRSKFVKCEPDLYTRDEWTKLRQAVQQK